MVFRDLYSNDEISVQNSKNRWATPGDRLLASFLDLLFHVPLFTLLTSFILYRWNLIKITGSSVGEKMTIVSQLIWVLFIGSVILQAIYFKLSNKTPGMRLLKLEIQSFSGSSLTWGQCLVRSFVWSLEIIFLGIPLLEIFSHPKRYAAHDRISETEIISLKSIPSMSPLPTERSMVHLVFTSVIMLVLIWMTSLFSITQNEIRDGTLAINEWRAQDRLCNQVDEIATYSDLDLSQPKVRLDFAISLFYLDQVETDCLRKEVDFSIYRGSSDSLVWVGRAILSAPYSDERKEYQSKACKLDSEWCQSALLKEKSTVVELKKFIDQNDLNHSQYKNVNESLSKMAAKLILFNRIGFSDKALKLVEQLQLKGIRATGLVVEQLRALDRTQSTGILPVLNTIKSVMVERDYLKVNSEICLNHLDAECSNNIQECHTMTSLLPKYQDSLNDLVVSRALFKASVCNSDLVEFSEYWPKIEDEDLQKLVHWTQQLSQSEKKAQSLSKLRDFVNNDAKKVELRFDALQILMSQNNFKQDWSLVPSLWKRLDWTQSIFLSASEWLINKSKKAGQSDVILSLGNQLELIPSLKWKENVSTPTSQPILRIPAQSQGEGP